MDSLSREISRISVYQTPLTLKDHKPSRRKKNKSADKEKRAEVKRQFEEGPCLGSFGKNVMVYEQHYDPKLELQVLQAISLRESLVSTLLAEVQSVREDRPFSLGAVLSTALQMRQAARRCLEEVASWREVLTRPMEFKAGEKNYLLKMLEDTGDALRVLPFSKLFRMELGGKNPFMLPYRTKRQMAEPLDTSVKVKGPKVKKETEFCIPDLLHALANPSEEELRWIQWGQLYLEEEERRYGQKELFQGGWGYHRWLKAPWRPPDNYTYKEASTVDFSNRGSLQSSQMEDDSLLKTLPSEVVNVSTVESLENSCIEGYEERFGKEFAEKVENIPTTYHLRKVMKGEDDQNIENEASQNTLRAMNSGTTVTERNQRKMKSEILKSKNSQHGLPRHS